MNTKSPSTDSRSRRTDPSGSSSSTLTYHRVEVKGVGVFYREAGPKDAPTIVLLHGFPSSSRMFDSLIPLLAPEIAIPIVASVAIVQLPVWSRGSLNGR